MPNELKGKRAIIWARVSEDKGQQTEGQLRALQEVAEREGLSVLRVYNLMGESVFRGEPREKLEVLSLARRRRFDVLLFWALDRWARRRRDGVREVFDVLLAHGVTVISLQEPWLSTATIPAAFREALAHLALWLAEEESQRKSDRVRLRYRTNRHRAAAGGGRARWGRGRIPTPADEEAVHQLRTAGQSIRQIAAATGLPKSTVADLLRRSQARVSEMSGQDGGPPPSEASARP